MERRGNFCRTSTFCHECKDAVESVSRMGDVSFQQGEAQPATADGKSGALGAQDNDPSVQLANVIVELEDGCVQRIKINDNESAEEVAKKVCRQNDLPDQFVALLAEHIIDRYPERPVDKKEEVTVTSEESKETKSGKSQGESSNSRESPKKVDKDKEKEAI